MTTIAYRNGVLAGDTMESFDRTIMPYAVRKVFRLPDGTLLGATGTAEACEVVRRALAKGSPLPKLEDVEAVRVFKANHIEVFEGHLWRRVHAPFYALGSGCDVALAAMYAGATAREAVAIAVKMDTATGGRVQTVALRRKRT